MCSVRPWGLSGYWWVPQARGVVPAVSLMVSTAFDVLLHLPESAGRMRLSISEPGDTGAGRWGRAGGR